MKTRLLLIILFLLTLSCEKGWLNEIISPTVLGCKDSTACNYNPDAEEDDGNCLTNDCAGKCGGDSYVNNCNVCDDNIENDCTQDCVGVWGGTEIIDSCNVCGGTFLIQL